ncbi:MAG: hypothetical protein JJU29_21445 [Verrucomicrobia bacterium]|nr:hypothetical protein [Verrucomicrobiota bacterium]MCH8511612.1 hypothetical protein [Kiritimatiellia bacterium]
MGLFCGFFKVGATDEARRVREGLPPRVMREEGPPADEPAGPRRLMTLRLPPLDLETEEDTGSGEGTSMEMSHSGH